MPDNVVFDDEYISMFAKYLVRIMTAEPEFRGKCTEIRVIVMRGEGKPMMTRVCASWKGMQFDARVEGAEGAEGGNTG